MVGRFAAAAGLALVLASAAPVNAEVRYFASGTIDGSSAGAGIDLSGLGGPLENGQPGDILGGLGSGLAYAGGNSFIAVPDRGPNAISYNSLVDDTTSYISRFQSLTLKLTPSTGGGLPFMLSSSLDATTLLYSPVPLAYGAGPGVDYQGNPLGYGAPSINRTDAYYFTGRSDGFAPPSSGNPLNARFDPESVRLSPDGNSVFISDEYGPHIRQFDRATGALVRTFALPGDLYVANQAPNGDDEERMNTIGRTSNKGMEGLAITPDGQTLVGIVQANLLQDNKKFLRIVTVDIASGTTHEYGYQLTTGKGVSDIVAINDHRFLVDERDGDGLGDGSKAKVKQFFVVDLNGATDITGLSGNAAANAVAVAKSSQPFLDLVSALKAAGIDPHDIPAKIEGIAFGQDVALNGAIYHTLYVANDNDFVPQTAGPNQFYVFGFQDGDLPGYVAERFAAAVPEPGTWAMMILGFGLIGFALRRRRRTGSGRCGAAMHTV